MTDELIARAKDGDAEAFRRLTEPHRKELLVHCYRMLGSFHDAEDTLQDAWVAAWQGFTDFQGRASVRSWLYKVATNHCLNARRAASRRPAKSYDVTGVQPPEPTRLGEVTWLEPLPDAIFGTALEITLGPDARYEQSEAVCLGFVKALQLLPPRQLAVLLLRDVLGFQASEVSQILESSLDAVNSALKRARARLQDRLPAANERPLAPAPGSANETVIATRFARAWEAADVNGVVALLTDDVLISMPPIPNEYEGRDLAAKFFASIFAAGRRFTLVSTRANGQPAFCAYLHSPSGQRPVVGLFVLTLSGDKISALTRFEPRVLEGFGLSSTLAAN
jgi:RNA polymerase sigma-70 factor (TIGR02960 family)